MRLIRALNHYFLSEDEEEITGSDLIWFYGFYGICFIIVAYTVITVG